MRRDAARLALSYPCAVCGEARDNTMRATVLVTVPQIGSRVTLGNFGEPRGRASPDAFIRCLHRGCDAGLPRRAARSLHVRSGTAGALLRPLSCRSPRPVPQEPPCFESGSTGCIASPQPAKAVPDRDDARLRHRLRGARREGGEGSFQFFTPLGFPTFEKVSLFVVLGIAVAGLLYALMLVKQVMRGRPGHAQDAGDRRRGPRGRQRLPRRAVPQDRAADRRHHRPAGADLHRQPSTPSAAAAPAPS